MRHQFVERNRIESGLSDVVLIVESAAKSGTLTTANFALDQGREVAAIPGNITSPTSVGCNNLIKTGALAATSVDDILQLLGLSDQSAQPQLAFANSAEEAIILRLITSGLRDGHDLLAASKLDASTFNRTLTMLEITGTIRSLGANQWTIA